MSWSTNKRTRIPFFSRNRRDDEIANEFLRQRAVYAVRKGSAYLNQNPKANGFTILHDDATGTVFDIDRPEDLATLHNVLPREDLFIITKDRNNTYEEAYATTLTTPQSIVREYGTFPGYRVTTTGGYRYADGHLGIDHGMLIATDLETAKSIGRKWNQESILELDNRGDMIRVAFYSQ